MLNIILGSRYKIIGHLGGGGFGQTYLARDQHLPDLPSNPPLCVVKQLKPKFTDPMALETARQLFNREAEVLYKLGTHDQIPRLFAHFEENQEFYLVMEFIEGDKLPVGQRLSEPQVLNLLQELLKILEFVHQQKLIHRDIKPSNIIRRKQDGKLVLIDFGVVKQVTTQTITPEESTRLWTGGVGTDGYMPPEQCSGYPQFSSDIYAVGMLGIQLLTGLSPKDLPKDPKTHEIIWSVGTQVSPKLVKLLDKMVRFDFRERYQTATEALQALQQLAQQPSPPPSRMPRASWLTGFAIASGAIVAIAALIGYGGKILNTQSSSSPIPTPSVSRTFSLGDKILITADTNPQKEAATKAFAKGDYNTAITQLQSSLQVKPNDPEALIYLNNAVAASKGRTLRIAVSVPIGGNLAIAQEILRGVAQAQDEVNRSRESQDKLLQVEIADDRNQPERAKQIASEFVKDERILAVVGHNASEVSVTAAPVYQKGGLVMVSPTSGASELSGMGSYIFRTVPPVEDDAKNLAKYAMKSDRNNKFAVCIDSASPYSISLGQEFKRAVLLNGGRVSSIPCDFSNPTFNPSDFIATAVADGVEGLLVTPSVERIYQAIEVAKASKGKLALFSGSTMYIYETLRLGRKDVNGMVLSVVWHAAATPENPFPNRAKKLWNAVVNWRTVMSYDATQAIVTGLKQESTRQGLQRVLSSPGFTAKGATGTVQFLPSGDRKLIPGIWLLVKVQEVPGSPVGYDFVPLKP